MEELKAALVLKRVTKGNLTKLKDKIAENLEDSDSLQLELFKSKIQKLNEELSDIFNKIFLNCKEDVIDQYIEEQTNVQEIIDELILKIKREEKRLSLSLESKVENKTEATALEGIKLPKLALPTFSGNLHEWITFNDLFKASVHNNPNITNAQKLQYLKSALKGDAFRIIQSIAISDKNYSTAWELLVERYSNKREQIFAHIKRLMSLNTIQNESASAILNLVDNVNEIIRALEILEQRVDNFSDTLVLYVILQKLDPSTKLWWERQLKKDEIPKLHDLIEFLKNYARTLQNSKVSVGRSYRPPNNKVTSFISNACCIFCHEEHNFQKCSKFLNLNVQKRIDFVKSNNLCFNCLSGMHHVRNCKSTYKCKHCGKNHHSILHIENKLKTNSEANFPSTNARVFIPKSEIPEGAMCESSTAVCASQYEVSSCGKNKNNQILLCTAVIKVRNAKKEMVKCRCLLDSGSQRSFISRECVNRLGLNVKDSTISVSCLGTFNTVSNGEVDLLFTPHFESDLRVSTSAFVIEKVTDNLPHISLPSSIRDNFRDLILADPSFYRSAKIDILLGVNVFLTLMNGDIIKRGSDLPFALSTKLGWIISGKTSFESEPCNPVVVNNLSVNTENLVKSFWELENIPCAQRLTTEEKLCEVQFEKNCCRDKHGRYSVSLPFKPDRKVLGNSRTMALNRFLSLEKRLVSMPKIYNEYRDFMQEYLSLGHMSVISPIISETENQHYYIPHHYVVNETSLTTKLRVVFDASAKSSSGVSLNDTLMVGPKTQDDLICILLRFRCHEIAITADIKKMYRQVKVRSEDCDFQRIFWRDSPEKQMQLFRLNTVTYGTASAPYLATRALKQLAIDESVNFSKASQILLRDFYVDDMLTGANSRQEGTELVTDLQQLLKKGGFELHKWSASDTSVLENSCISGSTNDSPYTVVSDEAIKVLGLEWHPNEDVFTCNFEMPHLEGDSTKRSILSSVARLFDPLGWISPFIILTKMLLQELWKLKLSWDDPVPKEIDNRWKSICQELVYLNSIQIPRRVFLPGYTNIDLHAFCDASEKGYGAVIYVRTSDNSNVSVKLLTSKTRVAPLKPISIPRMELCAAVLLVHLVQAVLNALQVKIDSVYAWSDSTIVLSWLKADPTRWQVFVANRVSEIQSVLPTEYWNHVEGKQNPADCASRGLLPSELVSHQLWWTGPDWLMSNDIPFSNNVPICDDALKEERKRASCAVSVSTEELPIVSKISSFVKLQRVFAWCLRFVTNIRLSPVERNYGHLTTEEMKKRPLCVIKHVQAINFAPELKCIRAGKPLPTSSRITNLYPFLDNDGVLRVGGRLQNANLNFCQNILLFYLPNIA